MLWQRNVLLRVCIICVHACVGVVVLFRCLTLWDIYLLIGMFHIFFIERQGSTAIVCSFGVIKKQKMENYPIVTSLKHYKQTIKLRAVPTKWPQ